MEGKDDHREDVLLLSLTKIGACCQILKSLKFVTSSMGINYPGHKTLFTLYLTTPNSARRFFAQADSLLAGSAGISLPKLTV